MVYSAGESTLEMVGSLIPRILPRTELVSLKRKHFPHYCKLWSIGVNGWELASFSGCSHLQFLIACSMQKRRGNTRERVMCMTSGRREGRHEGAVPDKEPSCPKTWDCNGWKTASIQLIIWIDSRLINARFVSYNDQALPLFMSTLTSIWHHARNLLWNQTTLATLVPGLPRSGTQMCIRRESLVSFLTLPWCNQNGTWTKSQRFANCLTNYVFNAQCVWYSHPESLIRVVRYMYM